MPFVTTVTLGCKVNQYETEYLRSGLAILGYEETVPGARADLVLLNTCTVTADSDAKSRKVLRKLAKEHPGAEIVVMGCLATREPEILAAFPNVTEILTDKADLPDFLRRRGLINPPTGIDRFGERHRAYIKVQDGCQSRCAYCVIPQVRPRLSSRPINEIVEEVDRLSLAGYREIVLTGIHLGFYRSPPCAESPQGAVLHDLVRRLLEHPGDFRLRISSLEASEVSDSLLDLMEQYPRRVCRHLHLSLQSGSDTVLRAMRRPHPSGVFLQRCEEIKRRLPNIALTTDIIVGFPGETESDFQAGCAMIERIGFSRIHVFRFSPRAGTEAMTLPNPVPHAIKQERAARLIALADRSRRRYAEAQLGREIEVLFEGNVARHKEQLQGTTDIYLPARAVAPAELIGRLIAGTVRAVDGDRLILTIR